MPSASSNSSIINYIILKQQQESQQKKQRQQQLQQLQLEQEQQQQQQINNLENNSSNVSFSGIPNSKLNVACLSAVDGDSVANEFIVVNYSAATGRYEPNIMSATNTNTAPEMEQFNSTTRILNIAANETTTTPAGAVIVTTNPRDSSENLIFVNYMDEIPTAATPTTTTTGGAAAAEVPDGGESLTSASTSQTTSMLNVEQNLESPTTTGGVGASKTGSGIKTTTNVGSELNNPLKQIVVTIEHKIRNLEKRKTKLESYREIQSSGKDLSSDQKLAVAKYDAVAATLDFARSLNKQIVQFSKEAEKEQKKQARKDLVTKAHSETAKIREVLIMQNIMNSFNNESVREDFRNGANDAVQLYPNEFEALDKFFAEVKLVRDPNDEIEGNFVQNAQKAAELYSLTIDARPKPYHNNVNYEQLREIFQKIQNCGYLDTNMQNADAINNKAKNDMLMEQKMRMDEDEKQKQQHHQQQQQHHQQQLQQHQHFMRSHMQQQQQVIVPPAGALPVFQAAQISGTNSPVFNAAHYPVAANAAPPPPPPHHGVGVGVAGMQLPPPPSQQQMHATQQQQQQPPPPMQNHFGRPGNVFNIEQAYFKHQQYLQQMRPLAEVIGGGNFFFLQESELDSPELDIVNGVFEHHRDQQHQQQQQNVVTVNQNEQQKQLIATQTFTNQSFPLVANNNKPLQAVPANIIIADPTINVVKTEIGNMKVQTPQKQLPQQQQQQRLFSSLSPVNLNVATTVATTIPAKKEMPLLVGQTVHEGGALATTPPPVHLQQQQAHSVVFPFDSAAIFRQTQQTVAQQATPTTVVVNNTSPLLLNDATLNKSGNDVVGLNKKDIIVNAWDAPLNSALNLTTLQQVANATANAATNRNKWNSGDIVSGNRKNNDWSPTAVANPSTGHNSSNNKNSGAFVDSLASNDNHWNPTAVSASAAAVVTTNSGNNGGIGGRNASHQRRNERHEDNNSGNNKRNNNNQNATTGNAAAFGSRARHHHQNNNNHNNNNTFNSNALAQNGGTDSNRSSSGIFFRNNENTANYFQNGGNNTMYGSGGNMKEPATSSAARFNNDFRSNSRNSNATNNGRSNNNQNASTRAILRGAGAGTGGGSGANVPTSAAYIAPRQSYRMP